jgi:excisionase family DNA binding protein
LLEEYGLAENVSEKVAAKKLGVSRLTLHRARKRGEISFYRIGTRVIYAECHLREFLRKRERATRTRTQIGGGDAVV